MSLEKYTLEKLLTFGSFGVIYLGRGEDGETVVIKVITLNNRSKEDARREANILKGLSLSTQKGAKYVVRYVDDFRVNMHEELYHIIVMENLSQWRTLDKYMSHIWKKCGITVIEPNILKVIVYRLLNGLSYIHENKIIHKDIKPENIMIDHMYNIKFIDFGFSSSKEEGYKGTPLYLPPESLSDHKIYKYKYKECACTSCLEESLIRGYKHDVWSLGIVFYQLANLSRYPDNFPFIIPSSRDINTFKESIKLNSYVYPSDYKYENNTNDIDFNYLIKWMLASDPKSRPTTQELLTYVNAFVGKDS